jgi:hypothetical protein
MVGVNRCETIYHTKGLTAQFLPHPQQIDRQFIIKSHPNQPPYDLSDFISNKDHKPSCIVDPVLDGVEVA